jgi:hypothetical protein
MVQAAPHRSACLRPSESGVSGIQPVVPDGAAVRKSVPGENTTNKSLSGTGVASERPTGRLWGGGLPRTGAVCRKKYLTVSFPYSNRGFCQVFGGETGECVCQGLKDIFEYIDGVPRVLVFDNATGVGLTGRRVGDQIREAQLFQQMRAHYGFLVRFCNPNAGHEKGYEKCIIM